MLSYYIKSRYRQHSTLKVFSGRKNSSSGMGIEKEETLFLQMPKKILSFSLNETQPALLKRQALFGELGSLIPETRVCFE